jgi:hypothetical protein
MRPRGWLSRHETKQAHNSRLVEGLSERWRYEAQIERLHDKHALTSRMFTLQQDGVPLAEFVRDRSGLARTLTASVAGGSYVSQPASIRDIVVEGKERRVFSYRLSDAIVHGVLADILSETMESRLSRRVFSYRKGVSRWNAVAEFAAYLRAHRNSHPDPRTRGIYVLRRDVAAYADSIPMSAMSPVWEMVREHLEAPENQRVEAAHWSLIERAVRPEFFNQGHRGHAALLSGVATGQPIACVLFNLYLRDLDEALQSVPGAYYARYSDDILFAHPDAGVARDAIETMLQVLRRLGLNFKASKVGDYFLTRPGRPSSDWPDARSTSAIAFLGTRISADGEVSLKPEKVRDLMDDLERRARTAMGALKAEGLLERGRVVCGVMNRCLDPNAHSDWEQGAAALLRSAVTDRGQLEQLDYRVARLVARVVTGDSSVRAFRHVPYGRIRGEWGLRSLLHSRNRWKRSSR